MPIKFLKVPAQQKQTSNVQFRCLLCFFFYIISFRPFFISPFSDYVACHEPEITLIIITLRSPQLNNSYLEALEQYGL